MPKEMTIKLRIKMLKYNTLKYKEVKRNIINIIEWDFYHIPFCNSGDNGFQTLQ